jgi:hypothetical protein
MTTDRFRKKSNAAFAGRTGFVRLPALVASGDHTPALERACDALATTLDATRLVAPGVGHFVAAAPGFADRLEQFLVAAG